MFQANKDANASRIQSEVKETKAILNGIDEERYKKLTKEVSERLNFFKTFRDHNRIIAHIDLDYFYVQAELLLNPDLDPTRPIAVGGDSMLSTSNYAARKFGIRAGMPGVQAKQLCPELVILPLDFVKYQVLSDSFHDVISKQGGECRHVGYDEAYIDLTDRCSKFRHERYMLIQTFEGPCTCYLPRFTDVTMDADVKDTKQEEVTCEKCSKIQKKHYLDIFIPPTIEGLLRTIRLEVLVHSGLTSSIGCAPTYPLAKVCSDINKPNNQFVVRKEDFDTFCYDLKLNNFSGIGPVLSQKLESLGIKTFGDALANLGKLSVLMKQASLDYLLALLAGLDAPPCVNGPYSNPCGHPYDDGLDDSTVGHEETFPPSNEVYVLERILCEVNKLACKSAAAAGRCTNCIYLKIKYADFHVTTFSKRVPNLPFSNMDHIFTVVRQLFDNATAQPIRLLGVRFGISQIQSDAKKQTRLTLVPINMNVPSTSKFGDLRNTAPKGKAVIAPPKQKTPAKAKPMFPVPNNKEIASSKENSVMQDEEGDDVVVIPSAKEKTPTDRVFPSIFSNVPSVSSVGAKKPDSNRTTAKSSNDRVTPNLFSKVRNQQNLDSPIGAKKTGSSEVSRKSSTDQVTPSRFSDVRSLSNMFSPATVKKADDKRITPTSVGNRTAAKKRSSNAKQENEKKKSCTVVGALTPFIKRMPKISDEIVIDSD